MSSFMTLRAQCDACDRETDVYADELFEFDCVCGDCGGVLVLHEEEGEDDADEEEDAEAFEEPVRPLSFDPATKSDTIDEEAAEESYRGGDQPTKADTLEGDPYAMAAMALDPSGSDRFRRASIEPASTALTGTAADAEPLPAWDGGDTQQVHALASADPELEAMQPVNVGDELQAALGDWVEVVELSKGTSGVGSRTYDAAQIVSPEPQDPPEEDPGKNGESGGASLFGEDLDWLALIDDRLQEVEGDEGEEGAGRVIIRLPEDAVPGPEGDVEHTAQLQQTMERLESGGPASLGALIMDGFGSARFARRYAEEEEGEHDTRDYPDAKVSQSGEPTQAHSVMQPEPKLGTKKWAAAFAEERPPEGPEDEDGGPTRAWSAAKGETEASTQSWSAGPATQPQLKPSQAEPAPAPQPKPPSSRHQRRDDGTRVIDRFRRQDLDPALVCAREVGSPEADYFRQLYQQIFQARNGDSPRSVLITSAKRGEGKTTIAANLAIAAARIPGKGVVLVDADPRGAGVLRAFGERSPMEGLLEALETGADPRKYTVQFNLGQMDVVPLGIRGSNAAELIASDRMGEFMRGLRSNYPDWPIIIDGSSILHSADPLVVAQLVDGVVLVVRAGGPQEDEVQRVTELLGRKRLLGVVLNDAREI